MTANYDLASLSARERQALKAKIQIERERRRRRKTRPPLWVPSAGPQTDALNSPADIVGYGGAAGGGKTDLALGLAATQHKHSVIFRRVFPNLRGIIERSREIFTPQGVSRAQDSYNETLHRWVLGNGRMIEFEACQYEKDKEKQRGRPRDFYAFDEATEFSQTQVEFIIAWLRSTNPEQRKRVLLTFNPPTDAGGSWIIDYFLPWFAYLYPEQFQHPHPAAPGELRWYRTEGDERVMYLEPVDGSMSRTFIPAKLADNPYLADTNYRSILNSLPEPLRSQLLHGDFSAASEDDPWQVIPTQWVMAAQERWKERERPSMPITAVGVDVARGGGDNFTLCKRYGNWFDEVLKVPGRAVPDGPTAAGIIQQQVGSQEPFVINIDIIGVGGAAYDSAVAMYGQAWPVNAAGRSDFTDRSGRLAMRNIRAEYHWRLREALDPVHGEELALPPDKELLADLCAPRYRVTAAGIQIESKEDIKERIGRSPDVGEAVMLALYMPPVEVEPGGVVVDEQAVEISPY